jgi:hypothetical protein
VTGGPFDDCGTAVIWHGVYWSTGTAVDEGAGDDDKVDVGDGGCETTSCDSPMDPLLLVAGGWLLGSFDESFWPSFDVSCSTRTASPSTSSLSCSTLACSQRAMSNGSNRREEDTSHQHLSARRMTAGSGAENDVERAAVRAVAKVALIAQELDTDEVSGMGCQ